MVTAALSPEAPFPGTLCSSACPGREMVCPPPARLPPACLLAGPASGAGAQVCALALSSAWFLLSFLSQWNSGNQNFYFGRGTSLTVIPSKSKKIFHHHCVEQGLETPARIVKSLLLSFSASGDNFLWNMAKSPSPPPQE